VNKDNVKNDKNNLFQNYNHLIWLLIYIGIGLALSFIFPFPLSFGVLLLVLMLLKIYRTDLVLKRQGKGGIKGLYKSMPSSIANRSSGFGAGGSEYTPIKFYRINCGCEHGNDVCPKCGSKAVKVG
jgi:hypothetical protein